MRPCIIAAFLERHDLLNCRRREHPATEARTNPSKVFPIRRAEVSSSRKRPRFTGPSAERQWVVIGRSWDTSSTCSLLMYEMRLCAILRMKYFITIRLHVIRYATKIRMWHVLVRTVWDVWSTHACDGLLLLSLCCWLWFNDLNVWYAIMVLTAINYQTTNPYILVYFKTKALL